MSQIPIEAVCFISPLSMWTIVKLSPMSKQAARKFCEQQGWDFTVEGRYFVGRCGVKKSTMLISNQFCASFFSR